MAQLLNRLRRGHLQWMWRPFYVTRKCHFQSDLFEKESLNGCPMWMKFVFNWPHSVQGACLAQIEPKFYIHGIWTHRKLVLPTPASFNRLYQKPKLDQMFHDYKVAILKYWPNLKDPENVDSALKFFRYEWSKHGLPAGIDAPMYLYYGLAIRQAIPDDFGIPIGIPITLSDASESAEKVMEKLELFGKHIGVKVPPEINTGYSPVRNEHTIDEIRVEFRRVCNSGRAQLELVTVGS